MISSSGDMIGFVGIPLFLRIALQVAVATMHFHIAHSGIFFRNIFSLRVLREQLWRPLEIVLEVQGKTDGGV